MKFVVLISLLTGFGLNAHAANKICLSGVKVMNELRAISAERGYPDARLIQPNWPAYYVTIGPVDWEEYSNRPTFRRAGLAIGPNDLRFAQTVADVVFKIRQNLGCH